jgi:ribulose-phosphate 3-epimerase
MKAGVAINPHTPVEFLSEILQELDVVLIMSVNPGFGGQTFIPHTYHKIKKLKKMIQELGIHVKIEVDGGVTLENAETLIHAGADVLVAGSSIFHAPDPAAAIRQMKHF